MIWMFLGFLLVCSFIIGLIGFIKFEFVLEIKKFDNGFFNIGITFDEYTLRSEDDEEEDNDLEEFVEQEIKIGLFVINLVFIFFKEKNSA